jgi:hypothetical protein
VEDKTTAQVRRHILRQIERDREELARLTPALGWVERVRLTADTFIPRIVSSAEPLLRHVESSLNSPGVVKVTWEEIKKGLTNDRLITEMDDALEREERLLSRITGDTVSKLVADFLCERHSDLAQNNRSTYPDLYFSTYDYSPLPRRTKDLAIGPALKGRKGRVPTSIPDGIEIKTCRGAGIRVDCHHDHQGLHLALTYNSHGARWKMLDLHLAYLSKADYRRSERHTTATTDKFSFGHTPFISVTTGRVKEGVLEETTC